MAPASVSSWQGVVQTAKPEPGGSETAKRLALLARLDPKTLAKLMKGTDPELVLRLTRNPELIERLEKQPRSLQQVITELTRLEPEVGPSLRGIRRFRLGGALCIGG